jgi:uncharacterized protein (TIGR01777 family)
LPPWQRVEVEKTARLVDGDRAHIVLHVGPLQKRWIAEHFDCVENERFRDRQISGPFASWEHTHRFLPIDAHTSSIEDEVRYELPAGPAGRVLMSGKIYRDLQKMFAFRHARTRFDLVRHAKFADRPPLRVALTGASGAIGSALAPFLTTAGHTVLSLQRRAPKAAGEIAWNTDTGDFDESTFGKCDAIVHLAGKNIATRWTDRAKRQIRESRIDVTRKLCERLARLEHKPGVLIAASAIGYYGDRGDELLTEDSSPGDGWLEQTCVEWEAATKPAREAGIRVVNLRTGVVLSAQHGALAKMLTPAKLGVAGRVGSGRQWMPWISMDDEIGVIHEATHRDDWHGPINAVTGSVRQIDFIRTLGKVLARPTIAPLPAAMVGILFGEMGRELLLGSTRVEPAKLKSAGFEWMLPDLEGALRFELGRMVAP